MKKLLIALCCVSLSLFAVSCSLTKAPADAAIKAGESAFNTVKEEAAKYLPDQVAAIDKVLVDAKAAFEKGDYKAALASAKDVPVKVTDLMTAVEAKKAELPKIWEGMAASLPKLITETKAAIASARGVDKAVIDGAKTDLKTMEGSLTKATDAFKANDLIGAVNIGTEIQNLAEKIKASLMPKVAGN